METPRTEAVVRMAVGPMREYAIIEHAQTLERELIESVRCQDILASAMAEIKATREGNSDQPIANIISGCISEIHSANVKSGGTGQRMEGEGS